jgi:tyrosine-protein kinase Etk/Wzc
VVRDKFDNRINKPDELRKHGYAVIGVIPNLNSFIQQRYSGASFGKKDGHPYSTSLVSLLDPMEPSTEAYRHIRTNIQFSIPDKVIRSILVTSPSSGDGKSTVAANLAIVMAQSGRRTLLIDADLRRPQQHHLFAVKREPGLVQVLFRECGLESDVFKTGVENLSLITAGGLSKQAGDAKTNGSNGEFAEVPNPAELLGSRRMREILDEIHNSYDVVIIDSPPVLAATDAVLLSTQCDATILVTRAGKTKEGELVFSQEALRDVGATMIGTLLNAFDIKMAYGLTYRYGAYSKYGYYSKYAYGKTASDKRRRQKS